MEGLRRYDEWQRITDAPHLPPAGPGDPDSGRRGAERPREDDPRTAIDGVRSIEEIAAVTHNPDFHVAKFVYDLLESGHLQLVGESEPASTSPDRLEAELHAEIRSSVTLPADLRPAPERVDVSVQPQRAEEPLPPAPALARRAAVDLGSGRVRHRPALPRPTRTPTGLPPVPSAPRIRLAGEAPLGAIARSRPPAAFRPRLRRRSGAAIASEEERDLPDAVEAADSLPPVPIDAARGARAEDPARLHSPAHEADGGADVVSRSRRTRPSSSRGSTGSGTSARSPASARFPRSRFSASSRSWRRRASSRFDEPLRRPRSPSSPSSRRRGSASPSRRCSQARRAQERRRPSGSGRGES